MLKADPHGQTPRKMRQPTRALLQVLYCKTREKASRNMEKKRLFAEKNTCPWQFRAIWGGRQTHSGINRLTYSGTSRQTHSGASRQTLFIRPAVVFSSGGRNLPFPSSTRPQYSAFFSQTYAKTSAFFANSRSFGLTFIKTGICFMKIFFMPQGGKKIRKQVGEPRNRAVRLHVE